MKDLRKYSLRGSADCPIDAYYGTGGPRHSAYAHSHPELEIMLVEKGTTVFRQGEQTLTLHANDILITPPNTVHGQQAYSAELMTRFMVISPEAITMPATHIFQTDFVEPLRQGRLCMPTLLHPGDPANTALLPILKQLRKCLIYTDNYKINRFSTAMAVCTALAPFCQVMDTPTAEPQPYPQAVRLCIEEIRRSYAQRLTLATLGKLVQMHPNYLCALFKEHTGQTVVEYMTAIRVEAAAQLLRGSDLPINKVAERCGFRSECLLYKHFKATMGMTPNAYRKQL